MKKIAVVILNWNGWEETKDCLRSITKVIKDNFNLEVIVVDNASSDGSLPKISKEGNNFKSYRIGFSLIENKENLGFAEGNNVGITKALDNRADYIVLLNNDTIVDANLFKNLLEGVESEGAGIVGPKIYFAKGYEFHKDRYKKDDLGKIIWFAGGKIDWNNVYSSHRGVDEVDAGQYDKKIETDFITGCCMFIKKEVFEKIGFFDEKYFLYLEDVDFCIRAKKAGYKLIYAPKAVLWHKNAQSSGHPGSKLHKYYQTRNRLLFGFKYGSIRAKVALFKEALRFLKEEQIKRKAIVDFLTGRFGKGRI